MRPWDRPCPDCGEPWHNDHECKPFDHEYPEPDYEKEADDE